MRGEVIALLASKARPLYGGLCNGPVPRESSDLARQLLDDTRLASHCGSELPCEIHVHADTISNWHTDLGPPARTDMFSGAPAWMYKIAILLQDHPNRDGFSVVPGSHKEAIRRALPCTLPPAQAILSFLTSAFGTPAGSPPNRVSLYHALVASVPTPTPPYSGNRPTPVSTVSTAPAPKGTRRTPRDLSLLRKVSRFTRKICGIAGARPIIR